jgi:hypothetical protein
MKRSFALSLVALTGCTHGGQTCTFPSGGGTAKIAATCLDGSLIGVDGDALIAYGSSSADSHRAVFRLDTRLGTQTTLTNDVYVTTRPVVANGEIYFLACDDALTCAFEAIPTAGGPARTVVALTPEQTLSPNGVINGFVVDGASIYWSASAVWSAPLAGGTASRLADAHGVPDVYPGGVTSYDESLLAVDDTGLYAAYSGFCPTTLEKIALDGSSRAIIVNDEIGDLVARDGVVYWMEPSAVPENGSCSTGGGGSGGGCGGPEYGSVRSWSVDAGLQIVQDHIDGHGFLVVDSSVAWTVGGVGPSCQSPNLNGIVQVVGGVPTTLAKAGDEGVFYSMVTDGARLYAMTRSSIWRVPLR